MSIKTILERSVLCTLVPLFVWAAEPLLLEKNLPQKTSPSLKVMPIKENPLISIKGQAENSSSPLLFKLNSKNSLKEMGLPQKRMGGGGGGVDGGGGNYANNRLLDFYQVEDLTVLSPESLTAILMKYHGEKIDQLSKNLPGFKDWFFEALEVSWYLNTKPVNLENCRPLSPRILEVCYDANSVIIDKNLFDKKTEAEQSRLIQTALTSYHLNLRKPNLTQKEIIQKNIFLDKLMQSSLSPGEIARGLQQLGALPDSNSLEDLRTQFMYAMTDRIEKSIAVIPKGIESYSSMPAHLRVGCQQIIALVKKEITACLQIANEKENAQDLCHSKSSSAALHELGALCEGRR